MIAQSRRGSSLVEFTLAGIPILFTIIAVMEISRGMWICDTLSYAVKEASRMAIVHGENCATPPNTCTITVATIVRRIADSSHGLFADQMNVKLVSIGNGGTIACNPLSACLTNNSVWPAYPGNTPGMEILITAAYPFQSPVAVFFPGFADSTSPVMTNLPASSQETIQF